MISKNYKKIALISLILSGVVFGSLAMAQENPGGAPGPVAAPADEAGALSKAYNTLLYFNPVTGPIKLTEAALKFIGLMDKAGLGLSNIITAGILAGVLKVVSFVVYIVLYFISMIGSGLFTLGGVLLELGMKWNANVINSSVVETGWTLIRNFTNLGFILAIIYISFVIMLRVESYEIKKVVAKLLLAAILINFSLTIIGIILGASDSVSNFFVYKTTGESTYLKFDKFALNIAGATEFQSLPQVGGDIIEKASQGVTPDLGVGFVAVIGRLVLVVTFTVLSNIVIFILAFMVFVRYFVLTALLIIAPMAWLCFAVPKLAPYFTKWWETTLKWIFFLPVTTFFLYLAVVVAYSPQVKNGPGSPYVDVTQVTNAPDYLKAIPGGYEKFGQMILSLALMITGLIAGEKLGLAGSATTMAAAKGAKNWAISGTGVAGGFALKGLLQGGQVKDEKGNIVSTRGQRLAVLASRYGLTGTSQTFDQYGSIDLKAPVEKQEKRFMAFKESTLLLNAQNAAALNEAEAAGLAKVLASKNLLSKVSNESIEELAKKSEKFGVAKEIYKVRPDLAPDVEKAMKAIGKSSQKAQLAPKVFESLDAVASLSNKDLEVIFKDPDEETIETIKKTAYSGIPTTQNQSTISRIISKEQPRIQKFIEQSVPGQTMSDLGSEAGEEAYKPRKGF